MPDTRMLRTPSAALGLLMCSTPAFASDYSGLPVTLCGGFGIAFAVVFVGAWAMTREIPQRGLRVLVLSAIAALFWSPIKLGASWWPVCCFFLDLETATEGPFSIFCTTVLLWGFVMCLPRKNVVPDAPS